DLDSADRAAVDAHLAGCNRCRAELAALSRTRTALDCSPTSATAVDANQIYRVEAERQRRAARRWQVAALVALAAAVLVLVSRLDVRVDGRQLTVRWGAIEQPVAPQPAPPQQPVVVQTDFVASSELEERLNVLTALIHALAANVESGDRERAADLARLRQEIAGLRRQGDWRWTETEKSVSALYAAQFGSRTQEDKP